MLLLKYHKATPADVDHSAVDLKSETFTVEITDSDGNTTSEERPVFHSVSAHVKLVDLMTYPYGAVTDDAKREQFCIALWGEVLTACAHIGRRTLTAVLTDVIDRSATTQMVSNELAQQATRKKASAPSGTPAKKTSAGSSSSSASKRGGELEPWLEPELTICDPHTHSSVVGRRACERLVPGRPVLQLVQGGEMPLLQPVQVPLRAQGRAQGQVPGRTHAAALAHVVEGRPVRSFQRSRHGAARRGPRACARAAPHCPRLYEPGLSECRCQGVRLISVLVQ